MLNIAEKISYVNFFLVYHLRVSNCCKNHSTDQHRLDIYNFFLSWYPKAPPLRLNFSHKPGFGRPISHMEKNLRAMSRIRSFFGHLGWFFLHMDNSLCYVNLIQRKPRCIPPKLGIARTFFSICPKATAEPEMPLPPPAGSVRGHPGFRDKRQGTAQLFRVFYNPCGHPFCLKDCRKYPQLPPCQNSRSRYRSGQSPLIFIFGIFIFACPGYSKRLL